MYRMAVASGRPQIEFRALKRRGEVRGAVLSLNGSDRAELKRACALAGMLSDRCILVAVDGGLNTCTAGRRRPDLFVGDGDSAEKVPPEIPAVLYAEDKDFSDLAGALAELRDRKIRVVAIAGLLGGRLDHEWSNLFELRNWARFFDGIVAPAERGTVIVTSRGCRVATVRNRAFSLFSLSATSTVTMSGVEYELRKRRIRPGSLGLSNVTGTELDLTVHAGVAALVFLPPAGRSTRSS
jgi:thiamine pyrophosphokinase